MAYLKHFEISTEDRRPPDDRRAFRATVYHVKEIFLYFLPKNVCIDGSSKFQITLCVGQSDFESRTLLGSTEFRVSYFDFDEYFSLSPQDQETQIVSLIRATFLSYCGQCAPAIPQVELALNKAAEVGYKLRYEVAKLRKSCTPRKLRVRVYRIVSGKVGETWWAEVERSGDVIAAIEMYKSAFSNLIDYYKRAQIADGWYIIYDGTGRVSFSTDLREFLQ